MPTNAEELMGNSLDSFDMNLLRKARQNREKRKTENHVELEMWNATTRDEQKQRKKAVEQYERIQKFDERRKFQTYVDEGFIPNNKENKHLIELRDDGEHKFISDYVIAQFQSKEDEGQPPGSKDDDEDKGLTLQSLVISHTSWFVKFWNVVEKFVSLVSAYVYMFFAAFGHKLFRGDDFHDTARFVEIGAEGFFLATVLRKFITDFNREGERVPVKSITVIAMRYLRTDFTYDIIPLLPFTIFIQSSMGEHDYLRLFYLLKVIRITRGL